MTTIKTFENNEILTAEDMNSIGGNINEINDIIETHTHSITANALNIGQNTDGIEANTHSITANALNIRQNTNSIKANAKDIATNANNITQITDSITENAKNIAINTLDIRVLKNIVSENRTYLLIGDSYGVSNYGGGGEEDEYLGSWAGHFLDNFAPNPTPTNPHKYICWAGAGFCKKGNSNAPLSTNFDEKKVFANVVDLNKYTPTFNDIIKNIQTSYNLGNFTDVVILAGWNDKEETTEDLSKQIKNAIEYIQEANPDIRIYLGMISWFNSNYPGCTSFSATDTYGLSGRHNQNIIANKLFKVEDTYKGICCQYKNVTYLTGIEQQFRRNPEDMIGSDGLHPTRAAKESIAKTLYNCLSEGNANLPDIRRIYLMETYCDENGWYWEKWSNGIVKIYRFFKKSNEDSSLEIKEPVSGGGYASKKITLSFPGNLKLKSIVHLGPFMVEHKYTDNEGKVSPWGYLNFEYCGFERDENQKIIGVEGYYLSNAERTISTSFNYSFSIIGTWRSIVV